MSRLDNLTLTRVFNCIVTGFVFAALVKIVSDRFHLDVPGWVEAVLYLALTLYFLWYVSGFPVDRAGPFSHM